MFGKQWNATKWRGSHNTQQMLCENPNNVMIIILADYVIAKIHSMMRLCRLPRSDHTTSSPKLVNNDNEAHLFALYSTMRSENEMIP